MYQNKRNLEGDVQVSCSNTGSCYRSDGVELKIGFQTKTKIVSIALNNTDYQNILTYNPFANTANLEYLKNSNTYVCGDGFKECIDSCCNVGFCNDPKNVCQNIDADADRRIYIPSIVFFIVSVIYWLFFILLGIRYTHLSNKIVFKKSDKINNNNKIVFKGKEISDGKSSSNSGGVIGINVNNESPKTDFEEYFKDDFYSKELEYDSNFNNNVNINSKINNKLVANAKELNELNEISDKNNNSGDNNQEIANPIKNNNSNIHSIGIAKNDLFKKDKFTSKKHLNKDSSLIYKDANNNFVNKSDNDEEYNRNVMINIINKDIQSNDSNKANNDFPQVNYHLNKNKINKLQSNEFIEGSTINSFNPLFKKAELIDSINKNDANSKKIINHNTNSIAEDVSLKKIIEKEKE